MSGYTFKEPQGIYEKGDSWGWIRCTLCGKEVRNHALSRASHGKVHVRNGEATTREEYTYDGPRTVYEPAGAPDAK